MRPIYQNKKQQRHGAIVPLVAVLLPLFLIMVAFAVDIGVISVAQTQLQNAADAGAVAALTAYQRNPANGDQAGLETMNAHNFLGNNLARIFHRSVVDRRFSLSYWVWEQYFEFCDH